MANDFNQAKAAYLQLLDDAPASSDEAVALREQLVGQLDELSQRLFEIRAAAIADFDTKRAAEASDLQLRVDFMSTHIDDQIIDLIDNSDDIVGAKAAIDKVNKNLKKMQDDSANLAKNLDRATTILGEFEKLIGWVKDH